MRRSGIGRRFGPGTLAAAALVVMAPLVASGPAAAAPDTASDTALAAPTPLPYDSWGLRESLRQSHGDAFGGLYFDDKGALVLAATPGSTSTLTASMTAFESTRRAATAMAAAPRHRFVEVTNGIGRLEALKQAVLDAPGLFGGDGPVHAAGVDDRSNTLRIGLTADTPDNRAAVIRAIGARPTEVSFRVQEPVKRLADRFTDVAPFNAGDRIYNQNSLGGCTSGFGVHQISNNTDYLITAAHCSAASGAQDFFWNGSNDYKRRTGMGFSTNVSFGWNGWDTQLIRTESSNISWTATATRSHITAPYVPVQNDGNLVINEGASSIPWDSGSMRVIATDDCVVLPDVTWGDVPTCHLWTAIPPAGACASKLGDSGGPIVAYTGYGPLAVGQVVGGSCGLVFFHAIGDMLAKNPYRVSGGLHVNTVGPQYAPSPRTTTRGLGAWPAQPAAPAQPAG